MEDAENLKQDQESMTVNFENLHANMALDGNAVGDATTEQKMQEEEEEKGHTDVVESNEYFHLHEDGIAQTEEKEGEEEKDDDDGNTELQLSDPYGNTEVTQIQGEDCTEDQFEETTQQNTASEQTQFEIGNTEHEPDGNTEIEEKDEGNIEGEQLDVAKENDTESSENAPETTKTDQTDSQGMNMDFGQINVEDIAKGIIKNAVDGATEQISMENLHKGDAATETSPKKVSFPKGNDEKPVKKEPEWLDILGNGLLKKKVTKAGEGVDSRPKREQEVSIKYEGRLKSTNDVVEKNDMMTFVIGEQDVLAVFDLVVALMSQGEIATVESDARYAYGEEGKPPTIPPNAVLIFEIELLEIRDGPFSEKCELNRRLAWADEKRQKGNKLYSEKNYIQATMAYTRATKSLEKGWLNEETEPGRIQINQLRLKCYNNLTASQMKQEKWKDAMQSCRAAELLEPKNVKTLFRKGKIHCEIGELEKGVAALSKAAKFEPDNKTVAAEAAKQKRRLEKQKESQKNMYRRMLGTKKDAPGAKTSPRQQQESSWFSWGRVLGGTLALGAVLVGVYIAQRT